MKDNFLSDKLRIHSGKSGIDLDILFGFLDRSFTAFNFETRKNENINGYNLMLNTEILNSEAVKELEEVIHQVGKLHKITLFLDGIITHGMAKISPKFGIGGVSIDLEVYNS